MDFIIYASSLVDTVWLAHGGVEGDSTDALPLLLEQGSNIVGGEHDVLVNLLLGHADVGDWNAEGDGLLKPELDGLPGLIDSISNLVSGPDWGWELTGLVEGWAESPVEGLDEGFGSKEEVVLLGPVLDGLLVLVEVGQGLEVVGWDVDGGSLLAVDLVTHDTDAETWADDVWKLDLADETLVLGDVVAL